MKTICPNCDHTFLSQDVYCEDWRNPEKSFGCPKCKIFFLRKERKSSKRKNIIICIAAGGIGTPASMIIGQAILTSNASLAFLGLSIIGSLMTIAIMSGPKLTSDIVELVRVDS